MVFVPSQVWAIKQKRATIQDIPSKNAIVLINEKETATKDLVEKLHFQVDGGCETARAVESFQFILSAFVS